MSKKQDNNIVSIDTDNITFMFSRLRLPSMKNGWERLADKADAEGWPAARLLSTLAEIELADRQRRRIQRHLGEARLLPAKSLESFDFDAVPTISRSRVMALGSSDSWLEEGGNVIIFGPPGAGEKPSGLGHRPCAGRKGEKGAVHKNHRPCAAPPDGLRGT